MVYASFINRKLHANAEINAMYIQGQNIPCLSNMTRRKYNESMLTDR
jgi:hypothetical protein